MRLPAIRRVLFAAHSCYLDASNGAAVASRALMRTLARRGAATEVLCGAMLDIDRVLDADHWVHRLAAEDLGESTFSLGAGGFLADLPPHTRFVDDGIPVTVHRGSNTRPHVPDEIEAAEFLRLLDATFDRFSADILVGYGGGKIAKETFARAKARGIRTVFPLHNFGYANATPFVHVDAILVASRFSADHYRRTLSLDCTVLPYLVERERVVAGDREPKYVTFVNPSVEKGVLAFARIADELGRLRPDIPLLVVEGRGDEATLAGCGLDLTGHGNVFLMAHTPDPRKFWRVTRLCLLPSTWKENQPMVAVEAMLNGIPVVGSDRGGIPETLGNAGIVLPLPDWLTPASRDLPTAEEVAPWVEAVIRLWDDAELLEEHRLRALAEARRWDPDVLEPQYARFFAEVRPRPKPQASAPRTVEVAPPWARVARSWDQIPGFFDFAEVYDAAVAAAVDGAVLVEVGCLLGRSTCYLATKIRESGKAITVYAVDTGRGSPSDVTGWEIAPSLGGEYAGTFHRNLIGCGLTDLVVPIVTESTRAARLFPPGSVDFAFIDGDHQYESVLADLRAWWPKVKPGGLLAGHDYRRGDRWGVWVSAAVHDFFQVQEASHPACPHCWAMSKSSSTSP